MAWLGIGAFAAAVACGSSDMAPAGPGSTPAAAPAPPPEEATPTTTTAARPPADGGTEGTTSPPPRPTTVHAGSAAPHFAAADDASEGTLLGDGGARAPASSPPFGAFAAEAAPRSKLALIMAVDQALQHHDRAAFGALWLDDSPFGRLCPGLTAEDRAELEAEQRERRRQAAIDVEACLALTDWSQARRLVLNYGSHTSRADVACSYQYLEHEDAELFYAVGDTVYKVKIYDAVTFRGWHALGRRIRCTKKKPGSAAKADELLRRLGTGCPGLPWPALTQIRGPCPKR